MLGWRVAPACGEKLQTAFRVRIENAHGKALWTGSAVDSDRSEGVPMASWSSDNTIPPLTAATLYFVSVSVALEGSPALPWSASVPFVTALSAFQLSVMRPMWAPNASAQFVLFRRELEPYPVAKHVYVSITAKPTPDWNLPHGRNTSHLLGAYKLWVNGQSIAAGPGRPTGIHKINNCPRQHSHTNVYCLHCCTQAKAARSKILRCSLIALPNSSIFSIARFKVRPACSCSKQP